MGERRRFLFRSGRRWTTSSRSARSPAPIRLSLQIARQRRSLSHRPKSGENISVTGAPVIATGTVSTMAILAKIVTSLLVSQGYTLAVLDTATNIEGLTIAQINNLSARDVLLLQASDTSVALSANLVLSLEAANMTVTAPSGSSVTLTAPKASISALSATTIAGLPPLGVSSIVSTNGSVTISVGQALALEGADLA